SFTLAQTFYMAAAIVAGLNVIMGLVFVDIATHLARSRWFAFAGSILIVLFMHASFLYNVNYTPSVFAMRFLPSFALVAALVRIRGNRVVTRTTAAAMVICSLWSFEAFASGLIVYATWLIIRFISAPQNWRQGLRGGV